LELLKKDTEGSSLGKGRLKRFHELAPLTSYTSIVASRSKDHEFMAIGRRVVKHAIGEKLNGEPLDTKQPKDDAAVASGRRGGANRRSGEGQEFVTRTTQGNRKEGSQETLVKQQLARP
jgi:hypothetical protein